MRFWQEVVAGLVFASVGVGLLLFALVLLNRQDRDARLAGQNYSREIEVRREAPRKATVEKVEQPREAPRSTTPQAPLPQLDSLLSGVDLGIKEFVVEDIASSAKSLLGDTSEGGILSESVVDVKPRVLSRRPVEYPRAAIKRGISGYVLVNLLINDIGEIEAARVLDAEPEGVFETFALKSLQNWRFAPAKYKGRAVKVWVKQRLRFDLN